ncbi:MAG: hypothetical protein IJ724_11725 [Muribaculaceae bacterium]|nr:hypothetical protein [Muribaculaceae bacterium]
MNGHLTSVTLGTGDTIWTLRAQNSRLLPTRVGLGGLSQSLSYDSGTTPSRDYCGEWSLTMLMATKKYSLLEANPHAIKAITL